MRQRVMSRGFGRRIIPCRRTHESWVGKTFADVSGRWLALMLLSLLLAGCDSTGRRLVDCQSVETGPGPEDFVILNHRDRHWVLIGSAERGGLLMGERAGRIEAVEVLSNGHLVSASTPLELHEWSRENIDRFHPVGMFLDTQSNTACPLLYVVNGIRGSIERFCIRFDKSDGVLPFALVHNGTLPSTDNPTLRPMAMPNDVVAVADERFFVSNFKLQGKVARIDRGELLEPHPRKFAGPNGLAYDSKRKLLYVASFFDRMISVFELNSMELGASCSVALPKGHHPDNLTWSHEDLTTPGEGAVLYVGTHGSLFRSACHLYFGVCNAPSGALRIDVSALELPTSIESGAIEPESPAMCLGMDGEVVTPYVLDISGVSTATRVGNRLIVSQLKDRGLSSCRLK